MISRVGRLDVCDRKSRARQSSVLDSDWRKDGGRGRESGERRAKRKFWVPSTNAEELVARGNNSIDVLEGFISPFTSGAFSQ